MAKARPASPPWASTPPDSAETEKATAMTPSTSPGRLRRHSKGTVSNGSMARPTAIDR
jgi:hypothetical protein